MREKKQADWMGNTRGVELSREEARQVPMPLKQGLLSTTPAIGEKAAS
jgi:hypothetical protein